MLVAAATIGVLALGLLAVNTVDERDSVLTDTDPLSPAPSTNPASVTEAPMTTPPTGTTTPAAIPLAENGLAENGLIAFVGSSAGSGYEIYVVASDGTGLRR
jgi:hypothetical protein